MSTPSTVTNRAQGNTYIGVTGMEIAVQTGFAIRTGFYLTNSGNSTVLMDLELASTEYDAFDFISGQDSQVVIPAGFSKLIGFDFYGLKDSSGPMAVSGPAGTGAYITSVDLTFTSQQDGSLDETFYSSAPSSGTMRLNITGFVTGIYNDTQEFEPSHPSGFLVETGFYDKSGSPYQKMKWENPSTGYYFEKYQLQNSSDGTENWSNLQSLSFDSTSFSTQVDDNTIYTYYYGTPTGLIGNDAYTGTDLSFNTTYYYRLRGEHYDSVNDSLLLSQSDWVYGYPVSSFSQDISDIHVLTGLVSGSLTLPAGGDPDGTINCDVGERKAMEIFLDNNEKNVNLKDRFDAELVLRGIDTTYFASAEADYSFTGVHFIIPEGYVVGSDDSSKAAIETGDIITDSDAGEVKTLLILKQNSTIAGRGGDGGDGGHTNIANVSIEGSITVPPTFNVSEVAVGSAGSNGTAAIKITDSNISEFQIWADLDSNIYGGGGGGGGGDSTFYSSSVLRFYNSKQEGLSSATYFTQGEGDNKMLIFDRRGVFSVEHPQLGPGSLYDTVPTANIKGDMYGGVGGGGQGFYSVGGKAKGFGDKTYDGTKGSLVGFGKGQQNSFQNRMGAGGNGGAFGEAGKKVENQDVPPVMRATLETSSFEGGLAGYAIDGTTNANYSKANFRSNLFFISKKSNIEDIRGFVAHWDANDTDNIYDTYNSSTVSVGGETIERWYPKNNHASLSAYILGGTTKPIWQTSSSFFNGHSYVRWSGTSMSATFQFLVGTSSPRLFSAMKSFEIFYNILPFDPHSSGTSQFPGNDKNHTKDNFILHKWSGSGQNAQFNSYMYDDRGKIVENAGLDSYSSSFQDEHFANKGLRRPDSSFVYNISGAEIAPNVLSYKVFNNEQKIYDTIIRNKFFSFIGNPVLGKVSGSKSMSFAISDIVIFNKKLNENERKAVNAGLSSKNKNIKTSTTADLNDEANRNRLRDRNGFAGFIFLNS